MVLAVGDGVVFVMGVARLPCNFRAMVSIFLFTKRSLTNFSS